MKSNPKKICVVTATRAEYGLLKHLMASIENSELLELQILVTGQHLEGKFGNTLKEIEGDGFKDFIKVDMQLKGDDPVSISRSMGLGIIGFGEALAAFDPDMVVLLGDRYELLCVAASCTVAKIPVAHIHGGEITEGAFDDAIRHAITKMSHVHFAAADSYARRIVQMGENPKYVHNVGGLGVDAIRKSTLLSRAEIDSKLGLPLSGRNLVITFHPVTLDDRDLGLQINDLLGAVSKLEGCRLIFTAPNADPESDLVFRAFTDFCLKHPLASFHKSLGQQLYYSVLEHVDGVVGNSSSGLLEAPTFCVATVNIGDRQKGRIRAQSVIDCSSSQEDIERALELAFSPEFQAKIKFVENPLGAGGASAKIVRVLKEIHLEDVVRKKFHSESLA